jgi:DNA-directed RNA polymerase specialized sigma24 family protein
MQARLGYVILYVPQAFEAAFTTPDVKATLHKAVQAGAEPLKASAKPLGQAVACARSPSPEQQVMDADNLVRAQEILDAMAPHRRDALLLHRIEGLTYAQIEERLSMSRTGVIMAIAEAVRELAEGLARAERRRTPPGR